MACKGLFIACYIVMRINGMGLVCLFKKKERIKNMILKKDKNILENIACMCKKNQNYNDDIINYSYNNYLNLNKDILKKGNLKLNKNIARFPLPEVVTCSCNCHGCYAKKRLFV